MFKNLTISSKLLKIPILISGILYCFIGVSAIGNLFRVISDSKNEQLVSSIFNLLIFGGIIFCHFTAFNILRKASRIPLRSTQWSVIPNTISAIFLLGFTFIISFLGLNFIAGILYLLCAFVFLVLIIVTFGLIFTKDWFSYDFITHYPAYFFKQEYKIVAYLVPEKDKQILVIFFSIFLTLFILPTLFSVLIVILKKPILALQTNTNTEEKI